MCWWGVGARADIRNKRRDSAMERMFILAALLVAGLSAAHAQNDAPTGLQNSGLAIGRSSQTGAGTIAAPCTMAGSSALGVTGSGAAASVATAAIGCGSDPLAVPAQTTVSPQGLSVGAVTGGTTGAATASQAGGSAAVSAPSSTNPETALQLPGEASNAPTQSANSTASAGATAPSGGMPSGALCATVPSSAPGGSDAVGLFAGVAASGC
jgi:hypothetical protein